jgi:hypothetical protein
MQITKAKRGHPVGVTRELYAGQKRLGQIVATAAGAWRAEAHAGARRGLGTFASEAAAMAALIDAGRRQ